MLPINFKSKVIAGLITLDSIYYIYILQLYSNIVLINNNIFFYNIYLFLLFVYSKVIKILERHLILLFIGVGTL